jgi:chemotaxis protein MotB
MRFRQKSENNNQENIFWVTMTDLMTGLVLVFMVLFFYTYVNNHLEQVQKEVAKDNAAQELQKSLDEQNIKAVVEPSSGVVKISDLELFELNSSKLSPSGKAYLAKFSPAYLNSIFSNEYLNKNVEKIIIQGHTDSQTFAGEYTQDEQYMKNMELSLNRAYEVANYMINTPYNKENGNRLRKMVLVEGASFSNPILNNGKEDFSKSRRVELKLVMKKGEKQ